jgi:seryl-tRNA synthetase
MLDRKFVLENVELVKQNCVERCASADIDGFVEVEKQRKALQLRVDDLNRQANDVAKSIGQTKDAAERDARKEAGRKIRDEVNQINAQMEKAGADSELLLKMMPNLSHPGSPRGAGDDACVEIRKGATAPRKFDFKPLDHVVLGEALQMIDLEAGAKVTGHGFYFLKNDAVLLELALQRYVLDLLIGEGFTPTITPDLARNEILQGIGFIPRGPETQIYSVDGTDLSLVATAEITLGGMLADQILEEEHLPLKYCGISHCYRTEAGSGGRQSRGLYRVHQFTKVEMFAFSLPNQSDAILEEFCWLECRIFDGLGIPYRVIDIATGDLGGPAYRKYDLEAWMPGRGEAGEYGEVTSTSNCTDYQARRLGIRYRRKGEKGTHFVHTLNGTAVAISRAMIAVMENYQNADGTITVPTALRAYMGKDVMTPPRR